MSKLHRSIRQFVAAIIAGATLAAPATAQQSVTLHHVHGLAYSADGKRLLVPSHHGLAVYEAGKWNKAPGPQHDYMGFAATSKHLYSSGHPAPGSAMVNPFGLIRSRDGGRTWDKLGLEGETDFHLLATSWNTNAIYVWNPEPSSRMRVPGLHSTRNDGFVWKPARAAGLEGDPRALAVHPEDAATVAVATEKGVYLSRDSGERFTAVVSGVDALAAYFELDGRHLWYGAFDGQPILARVALEGGAVGKVALPPLARDAVAYIAQNPARRDEFAIATFRRNVFLSADRGRNWRRIAAQGETK
ncbi:MAG TPA: glycosyl hydrolase [Burkholderiales bacterium]|nr:glycosyl hydrolase [Burkholderiales bacterium]